MDYESDPGWQYLRRSREQILEDQSRKYDSKKNVWISDADEGYIAAEIKATKGDQVTVVIQGGIEKTVRSDEVQEMNPPKFEKTEDMSNLSFLNDASVLNNLRSRYSCMLIYTYSGLFCVVINPYKRLPIYTDSVARMFMGKRRTEMPPHLFAVSDEAYRSMLQNRENQSMLITGESGAGKTENTKKVIAYFASVGASQLEKEAAGAPAETGSKRATLEDKIVQTNPVLEAFGNAKTVRNNNSSRFGKFIRIHFNKTGKVASCDIEHYLLEKSRVIRQAPGERCYHIFYQMFSGYKADLLKTLLLDKPVKEYYFIAQAELIIDGIDDREEHQLTDEAFRVLNFSETEIADLYKLVSAILHMGNMKFKQRPREEQAETDGTGDAEKASKMYGVTTEDFLKALLRPRVKVGTEWVNKGQNMEQVAWSVGAMAKGLYSRIFNWLVKKCNETLTTTQIPRDFFIGVLDIAGFEIFDFNSFEQLWINYVNEKLQQFFNHHMFVLEQEEYAREGISWVFIDFGLDLQACIELIEKPMGIIAMLDEECIVPKASDNTLAQKLVEQHLGKHPHFEKAKPPKGKQAEAHFGMRHYAGTVRYNVSNWLEKNKDPLNDSLVSVMKGSESNKLLMEVWGDYTTQEEAALKSKSGEKGKKKGKSGSFMTVSMMYRESLNNLMTMLNTTHPHFIRCIIPNEKKQSGLIDAALVLNQLTCNGVLEGIRICRKGFPNRSLHQDFVQRYALLAPEEARAASKDKKDMKDVSDRMLKHIVKQGDLKEDNYRVGLTKIFFKAGVVATIEDLRDQRLSTLLTGLQAQIRWYCAKAELERLRKQTGGIVIVQRNISKWLALQTWVWFKFYVKVRPFLVVGKEQEEMDAVTAQVNDLKENVTKEREARERLQNEARKVATERAEMEKILEQTRSQNTDAAQRLDALNAAKEHLENNIEEVNKKLGDVEHRVNELSREKKRVEADVQAIKKQMADCELSLRKAEADKQARQNQMASLVEEKQKQEAQLAKLNRGKKHQQEIAEKLSGEIKAEEERSQSEKSFCQKLQNALESAESELDREKRQRAEGDKAKRKLDGELRIARENLEEALKQRQDADAALKRKETELFSLTVRVEGAQSSGAKLSRQFQEQVTRLNDIDAELQTEREARARSERARNELQAEIDDLQEQLQQHSAAASTQLETNKKKDAEITRVRREIEQLKTTFDAQCQAAKKKGADASGELRDQIDQLSRQRAKAEKEKATLQRRLHDASLALDDASRQRSDAERQTRALDAQINELRVKSEELQRQVAKLNGVKSRIQFENSELMRQLDDFETKIANATRLRAQFSQQAEELKRAAGEEAREKQSTKMYAKNLEHELEQIRESLEEEIASKSDLLRQLSREQSDAQQWRSRFESAGLLVNEDADETRRRQVAEIARVQNELDAAVVRLTALERQRTRIASDAEAAHADADQLAHEAQQLEKQQNVQEKTLDEWRRKADDFQSELDAAQREARSHNAELQRVTLAHDQTAEQVEALRRENKQLAQDIHELQEQLNENSRAAHESEMAFRRLEVEKNELQHALDEAEAALEAEEGKVLRSQVEVAQIRAEIEKRLQEKDEEFENVRKNHQNTVDTLQNSLDQESKAKAELARAKKKLESDIAEFQLALEHATRANEDAQRNLRRCADQVKELQQQADEDQQKRDDFHERFLMTEKHLQSAKNDFAETRVNFDGLQRTNRQLDTELAELQLQNNELHEDTNFNASSKSKLESELVALQADLNEARNEVDTALDRGKRATADAARLAEELRAEQERSNTAERQRKGLEFQLKEMQTKIDEAEHVAARGGAKTVAKLESQLKSIESELEAEQRRHIDAAKGLTKADRRARELLFQVEEERKNYAKLCDLSEKLQTKIKAQRRMLDEAEESANVNLQKYRTVQSALDTAQERADNAESTLVHVRSRSRVNATRGPSSLSRNGSVVTNIGGALNKSETIV